MRFAPPLFASALCGPSRAPQFLLVFVFLSLHILFQTLSDTMPFSRALFPLRTLSPAARPRSGHFLPDAPDTLSQGDGLSG